MLSREEKQRLKTLEEYDRGVTSRQIKPIDSTSIEDIINYMANPNPWEQPTQMSGGPKFTDVVKETFTIPTGTSMVTSELGGRIGSRAGRAVCSPYSPLAQEACAKVGEYGGRVLGAGLGGAGGKAIQMGLSPEEKAQQESRWNQLYGEGMSQAEGEALGIGTELGWQGIKAVGKLVKAPASFDVKQLMAYMQDQFEKSLVGLRGKAASTASGRGGIPISEGDRALLEAYEKELDPEAAARVTAYGGLTKAERANSRLLDLIQGAASGSWLGGGRMRLDAQTRDQLLRMGSLQLGIDVGKYVDPSDLANAVIEGSQAHLRREPGKLILTLRQGNADMIMNGILTQVKSGLKIGKLESNNSLFGFATQFNGQFVSPGQYRFIRDKLQEVARDVLVNRKDRLEALRLTGLLDQDAMKWMPKGAKDDLVTLQRLEKGVYDQFVSQSFFRGLLSGENNSRALIDNLMQNPDYRRIKNVIELVPDPEVQNSLRRALVERLLGQADLPGGQVTGKTLRQQFERKVGRVPIQEVVGQDVKNNMQTYIAVLEHLQAYKGRGETGRVMTTLTQGTMFNRYAAAMGMAAAGGELFNMDWAVYPSLAAGAIFLLGPGVASRYLTSARAKDYIKFAKAAQARTTTPQRMRKVMGDVMQGMVDNNVVTRLMGRGLEKFGVLPGDQELLDSLQQQSGRAEPEPTAQPGPNYPQGMELGR